MKIVIAILALVLAPLAAQAQIMKCVGAGGRVEFASACPPGTKAESTGIRNNPTAPSSGAQKSLAERDAEFRKRRTEQQEEAKKADEKAKESAERRENCQNAQTYLRSLQSGQRIAKSDPKTGERIFLDDADRQSEIARAQRTVDLNCK